MSYHNHDEEIIKILRNQTEADKKRKGNPVNTSIGQEGNGRENPSTPPSMKETAEDILFRHYATSEKGDGTYEVTIKAMKEIADKAWEAGYAKRKDEYSNPYSPSTIITNFLAEMINPPIMASGITEKEALINLINDLKLIDIMAYVPTIDDLTAEISDIEEGSGVTSNGIAWGNHPGLCECKIKPVEDHLGLKE